MHRSQGEIKTDLVVAAAGIWAPKVGGMADVPIPLSPMQHLYAVTDPLPELAGATEEVSLPLLRHQDKAMYFRQVGESIGIGSYLPRTPSSRRRRPPRRCCRGHAAG